MWAAALLVLALLGHDRPAHADATPQDRAIAQTLFDDGRRLMGQNRYAEACAKFDESEKLDPSVGTQLNLAVCRERQGMLATAWEQYKEVATAAKREGQPARVQLATDKAAALEPRLSRLTVTLAPGADVAGLVVRLDGVAVDRPVWNTPLPLDGGRHEVVAEAEGRTPWKTTVEVAAERDAKTVQVPVLEVAAAVTPPPPQAPVNPAPTPTDEATAQPRGMSGTRIAGIALAGVGVAGVVVGSVYGVLTGVEWNQQKSDCASASNCPHRQQALQDHQSLTSDSIVSTIAFVAGGVLIAGGVVLYFVGAPSSPHTEQSVLLAPAVGPGAAGLDLRGTF